MVLLFFGDSVEPEAYFRIKLGETTEDGDHSFNTYIYTTLHRFIGVTF